MSKTKGSNDVDRRLQFPPQWTRTCTQPPPGHGYTPPPLQGERLYA